MSFPKSSCCMKDKDCKEDESIFKHDQDVLMPGFRFHPTEEELVDFYLRRKVEGKHFNIELITSIDLYRYDPWELPALSSVGEKEWFFYVQRDRKYRNGDRPNRVTTSGYWKATGADRMVRNEFSRCIGLKKTLVFYKGKAPKGKRTTWIMNEYRLPQPETQRSQKKELSLCRVYKKPGGPEEGRQKGKERHNRTENHEMQEWASKHQCQTSMPGSNPTTEAEPSNFKVKEGSTDEIVKFEESSTNIKIMPKSIIDEERYPANMEYGVLYQSENIREHIYSEGVNVWSTVSRPVSLNEQLGPSLTTCLMCSRAPDQLAMAEDLYNNNPCNLVLTKALTYGACVPACSDKLWDWNPLRNNGNGPFR